MLSWGMVASLADLGIRRADRAKVCDVVQLVVDGVEHPVKLLDVSPLGTMVETDLGLTPAQDVQFIRCGVCIPSQVVWIMDSRAGLEFCEPDRDEAVIRALGGPHRN